MKAFDKAADDMLKLNDQIVQGLYDVLEEQAMLLDRVIADVTRRKKGDMWGAVYTRRREVMDLLDIDAKAATAVLRKGVASGRLKRIGIWYRLQTLVKGAGKAASNYLRVKMRETSIASQILGPVEPAGAYEAVRIPVDPTAAGRYV